jgi:hypothetical protein
MRQVACDPKLHFSEVRVRHQRAIRVSYTRDQRRYFGLGFSPVKQDYFLGGRPQKITGLKPHSKRRSGNLGYKYIAVIKPIHVSKINFLGRERSIFLPSIVSDEMSRKYFVTHFKKQAYNLSSRYDGGAISGNGETKINFHGDMKFNTDSIFVRFEKSALTNVAVGAHGMRLARATENPRTKCDKMSRSNCIDFSPTTT